MVASAAKMDTKGLFQMSPDLEDICKRLNYCHHKLSVLDKTSAEYTASAFDARVEYFDNDKRYNLHFTKKSDEVPVSIRSEAGLITNELRACLDALACVLAIRNGKTTNKVNFPISDTKTGFETKGIEKIKKLSDADRKTITDLRPYTGGFPDLRELHLADIERKHIGLSTNAVVPTSASFRGLGGVDFGAPGIVRGGTITVNGRIIADGCQINTTRLSSARIDEEVTVATNLITSSPLELKLGLFYEAPDVLKGREMMPTLSSFYNLTGNIVKKFSD